MNKHPIASVIIVSFNTRELLRQCITSLEQATGNYSLEIIVVDNDSKDGSADMIRKDFPHIRLLFSNSNLGFAAANNWAFTVAKGKYWILLNSDAQMDAQALEQAISFMNQQPRAGMVGAKLISPQGDIQPSARQFPSLTNEVLVLSGLAAKYPKSPFFGRFDRTWADPNKAAKVDWVPGAFAIIRPEALRQVGYFDERFFLYYEEVDLCRRLKEQHWDIWYQPQIVIQHIGGESSKTIAKEDISSSGSQLILWRMRSALLYYRKHHGLLSAWLLSRLETVWHLLREFKAHVTGSTENNAKKAAESKRITALMYKAWQDTHGGKDSPPSPW